MLVFKTLGVLSKETEGAKVRVGASEVLLDRSLAVERMLKLKDQAKVHFRPVVPMPPWTT